MPPGPGVRRRVVGADRRADPRGLPPRPGLHPVRQDRAHLPQPAAPQELLGTVAAPPAHLDGVVVPPHRTAPRTRDPWDRRERGSRSPPPVYRTGVRSRPKVHAPTDSASTVQEDPVRDRPAGRCWCPCGTGTPAARRTTSIVTTVSTTKVVGRSRSRPCIDGEAGEHHERGEHPAGPGVPVAEEHREHPAEGRHHHEERQRHRHERRRREVGGLGGPALGPGAGSAGRAARR